MEHLEKVKEAREDRQMVTADKPLLSKPPAVKEGVAPSYTAVAKSKK